MATKDETIRKTTRRLYRLLNKHARLEAIPLQLRDDTHITHRELHAIEAIGERSPLNVTELGAHFGVTKSAASQMISKLTAKGLVSKTYAAHSSKEYRLSLTELGQLAFRRHERMHDKHMSDLVARLGAFTLSQLATASDMLEVIEAVVDDRIEKRLGSQQGRHATTQG